MRLSVSILLLMFGLSGCCSRQIYESATGWRHHECQKILEDAARARCVEQAGKDYDTYRREKNGI